LKVEYSMIKYLFILCLICVCAFSDAIIPIPEFIKYDKSKALLGQKLFFDPGLSKDGTISCASCHTLPGSGADATPFSYGINGLEGDMNSPTVLNARFNLAQFWDGRAKDLEDQVRGPIMNPVEMDNTLSAVVAYVKADKNYKKTFNSLYPEGVNEKNIFNAIAEFEKALYTPDSAFDRYLKGDKAALNAQELRGYELFQSRGCISCHNGVNIGGNMYQKLGIMKDYKDTKYQLGRYNVTKDEDDKYYYKVPTLRNIALSAPYLHDGSGKNLQETIRIMMEYQLGITVDKEEVLSLEAFLKTLTGQTPAILEAK